MLRALLPLLLLAGCGQEETPPPTKAEKKAEPRLQAAVPAPGEAGGRGEDGTAVPEESAKAEGAQGAATVLETYYGLIEAGKYREAWKLRSAQRGDESAFAASFGEYSSYRADVGTPSQVVGADGWLYVEVPVQIYVKTKGGEASSSAGSVSLRRKEKGSAAERQWRIYS